ncbi:MAG: FIST signal transduction protein [Ferruginibacter sp.]
MQAALFQYRDGTWENHSVSQTFDNNDAQLVLCFGGKKVLENKTIYAIVKEQFRSAEIILCSTAGEIYQDMVIENSLVVVALHFVKTMIRTSAVNITDYKNSFDAAISVGNKLSLEGLRYVMVFSDGRLVNGSELVKGLNMATGQQVLVTGGLAGDDANFNSTLVGLNEQPTGGKIVVAGFYGDAINITHGSNGGWDIFGLEKEITRSSSNVLFEIEGQNALELYKKYLGAEAENLPASALLFPLYVTIPGAVKPVVRTILSIDEEQKSMTFAGDVPEGSKVKFMKANFDRLTEAASIAAKESLKKQKDQPAFAMLVSCVGRKLILSSRTVEEVQAVNNSFGGKTVIAGFYSYGEISPFNDGNECQLHNQTMTITSFFELV